MERFKELTLESDAFEGLKIDFDEVLMRTLANMEARGADEGTMSLKLKISLDKSYSVDDKAIVMPSFEHEVSSVVQIKDKVSGVMEGEHYMTWDSTRNRYVIQNIDDGQNSLFDEDEDVPTDNRRYEWLQKFVGANASVTEAMGNYAARTIGGNSIMLSSATSEGSPYYCDPWILSKFVNHTLECSYDGRDIVIICNESGEEIIRVKKGERE